MAKLKDGFSEIFDREPLSYRTFKNFPQVFGGDDPNLLQTANRAISQIPLDIFDLIGRAGETAVLAPAAGAAEAYKALGGGDAQGERLGRDIYGLAQMAGIAAGARPSASMPSARVSSTRRAPASEPALDDGIMKALPAPKSSKAIEGEIVTYSPTDDYLKFQAKRDKASSQLGRESAQEDMDMEALTDMFEDVRDDIDDHLDQTLNEPMYEKYGVPGYGESDRVVYFDADMITNYDEIFDTIQDEVGFRLMKGEKFDDAIVNTLDSALPRMQDRGMYMETDDIVKRIAPKAKEAYGVDLPKALANKRSQAMQRGND